MKLNLKSRFGLLLGVFAVPVVTVGAWVNGLGLRQSALLALIVSPLVILLGILSLSIERKDHDQPESLLENSPKSYLQDWPLWKGVSYLAILLPIRGLALWLIFPLTFVFWVALGPIRSARRLFGRALHPSFLQYVTWVDSSFIAVLNRTLLRPYSAPRIWPRWPKPGEEGPLTRFTDAI